MGLWVKITFTLIASNFAMAATAPLFVVQSPNCQSVWLNTRVDSVQSIQPHEFRVFGPSLEGVNSLSKMVRDNPEHWWGWLKNNQNSYPALQSLVKYQGLVVGDAHLGNIQLLVDSKGSRYVPVDEGSGIGPFIFDIARLIMTTKSIFKGRDSDESVKIKDMLSAYETGLSGRSMPIPASLKRYFETDVQAIDSLNDQMISKKIKSNGKFVKTARLHPITDKIFINQISALLLTKIPTLNPSDIIDFASRIVERGGSAYRDRIWVSVRSGDNYRIIELKETGPSDLENYQTQSVSEQERFDMNARVLMGQESYNPFHQLVVLNGTNYWLRTKKVSLLEVPYQLQSKEDFDFTQDLAMYAAYTWGQIHRKQLNTSDYNQAFASNFESIRSQMKSMIRDYLKLVKHYQSKYQDIANVQ